MVDPTGDVTRRNTRVVLVALCLATIVALLASACSDDAPEELDATSFRAEMLRLDSPENAVAEIVSAYDDRDLLRAILTFDPAAQRQLTGAVFRIEPGLWQREARRTLYPLFDGAEHSPVEPTMQLARWMGMAATNDLLWADLAGATVQDRQPATGDTVDLDLVLANGDEVVVRTRQQADGTWRIAQVAMDGLAPDSDGAVFLRRACPPTGFEIHEGADCPPDDRSESISPEDQQRIDDLRAEAGNDINAQIAAAQEITDLINAFNTHSDADICGMLQGVKFGAPVNDTATVERATLLLETTCPGNLDYLTTEPPEVNATETVSATSLYGTLDLQDPESAVTTFVTAYEAEAFLPVFLILDLDAQRHVDSAVVGGQVGRVLTDAGIQTADYGDSELRVMAFVRLMEAAGGVENGRRLELEGPTTIVSSEPIEWGEPIDPPTDAQLVEATVGSDTYFFVVTQALSGRWRVAQVAADLADLDREANTPFLPSR